MAPWLALTFVLAAEHPSGAEVVKWELLAGAGTAAVVVPATVLLARGVGSIPSNRYLALVPPMLLMAIVPPLATVLVSGGVADKITGNDGPLWPALLVTTGVQIAVLAAAIAIGASAQDAGDVTLFALADTALLAGTSTAMLGLTRDDGTVAEPVVPPSAGITLRF